MGLVHVRKIRIEAFYREVFHASSISACGGLVLAAAKSKGIQAAANREPDVSGSVNKKLKRSCIGEAYRAPRIAVALILEATRHLEEAIMFLSYIAQATASSITGEKKAALD
jgi:hypothetical protein